MATTKLEQCKWCIAKVVLPIDAETMRCQRCGRFSSCLSNNFEYSYNNRRVFFGPQGGTVLSSPPVYAGGKRAVLCGVSYKNHPKRLHGSINDVMCMKRFLVQRFGFPEACIFVLTEDEKDPWRTPTRHNILRALSWLVDGCKAGDSLVFHYSGHASRVVDENGDEIDGDDEALCPVDYQTQGKILDDELNATIVYPLPPGVTLHAIIDTCFSGTFLDLPYMCGIDRRGYYLWKDYSLPFSAYKGTRGGLAISISACDDYQTSGDMMDSRGGASGALTQFLIKAIENEPTITYAQLLIALRKNINWAHKALTQNSPFPELSSLEPRLSTSNKFDINSNLFI